MPNTKRRQLIEKVILWMIEYINTERCEAGDQSELARQFEKFEKEPGDAAKA